MIITRYAARTIASQKFHDGRGWVSADAVNPTDTTLDKAKLWRAQGAANKFVKCINDFHNTALIEVVEVRTTLEVIS